MAIEAVQKAFSTDLSRGPVDGGLIDLCFKLADEKKPGIIAKRAQFYAGIEPDSSIYYPSGVSKEQAACHLVALLTDLPPGWLFDCATNRRGDMPEKSPVVFPPSADEVR